MRYKNSRITLHYITWGALPGGPRSTAIFWGSARPEKILATRMRKGPPPYVGMGPPNG